MRKLSIFCLFSSMLLIQINAASIQTCDPNSGRICGTETIPGKNGNTAIVVKEIPEEQDKELSGTRDEDDKEYLMRRAFRIVNVNFIGYEKLKYHKAIAGIPVTIQKKLIGIYKRNELVTKQEVKNLIREVEEETESLSFESIDLPVSKIPGMTLPLYKAINFLITIASDTTLTSMDKAAKVVDAVSEAVLAVGNDKAGVPDAARVIKDVAGIIRATTVSVANTNSSVAEIYSGVMKGVEDIVSAISPNSPAHVKVTKILDGTVNAINEATTADASSTKVEVINGYISDIIRASAA